MMTDTSIPFEHPLPAHFPEINICGEPSKASIALYDENSKPVDWALCGSPSDAYETLVEWGCTPDGQQSQITFSNDKWQTAIVNPAYPHWFEHQIRLEFSNRS